MEKHHKIPKNLQGVLWSVNVDKLDLEKDKVYIIHQVLMYGGFREIRWLFRVYPFKTIRQVFINHPLKVYTKTAFNYVKNHILNIRKTDLLANKYVNTFYGPA